MRRDKLNDRHVVSISPPYICGCLCCMCRMCVHMFVQTPVLMCVVFRVMFDLLHISRFHELSPILEPGRTPKMDKAVILSDVVRVLTQLIDKIPKTQGLS